MEKNARLFLRQLAELEMQACKLEKRAQKLHRFRFARYFHVSDEPFNRLASFRSSVRDMALIFLGEEAPLPWQLDLTVYLPAAQRKEALRLRKSVGDAALLKCKKAPKTMDID